VTTGILFEYSPFRSPWIHGGYTERGADMNTHITQRSVEAAKPPVSGYIILFDDKLDGFGIRESRTRVGPPATGLLTKENLGGHGPCKGHDSQTHRGRGRSIDASTK